MIKYAGIFFFTFGLDAGPARSEGVGKVPSLFLLGSPEPHLDERVPSARFVKEYLCVWLHVRGVWNKVFMISVHCYWFHTLI